MKAGNLTDKQKAFVAEYLVDLNGTQAAIRAGFSKKTAESAASRLLRNVKVSAEIEIKKKEREARTQLSADYVLTSLKEVADRCMTAVPVMEFDYEEKAMVEKKAWVRDEQGKTKEVGIYEFDSSGANRALELLGKHFGLFKEKIEHSGPGGGPITTKSDVVLSDLTTAQLIRLADVIERSITKG